MSTVRRLKRIISVKDQNQSELKTTSASDNLGVSCVLEDSLPVLLHVPPEFFARDPFCWRIEEHVLTGNVLLKTTFDLLHWAEEGLRPSPSGRSVLLHELIFRFCSECHRHGIKVSLACSTPELNRHCEQLAYESPKPLVVRQMEENVFVLERAESTQIISREQSKTRLQELQRALKSGHVHNPGLFKLDTESSLGCLAVLRLDSGITIVRVVLSDDYSAKVRHKHRQRRLCSVTDSGNQENKFKVTPFLGCIDSSTSDDLDDMIEKAFENIDPFTSHDERGSFDCEQSRLGKVPLTLMLYPGEKSPSVADAIIDFAHSTISLGSKNAAEVRSRLLERTSCTENVLRLNLPLSMYGFEGFCVELSTPLFKRDQPIANSFLALISTTAVQSQMNRNLLHTLRKAGRVTRVNNENVPNSQLYEIECRFPTIKGPSFCEAISLRCTFKKASKYCSLPVVLARDWLMQYRAILDCKAKTLSIEKNEK